MLRFNSINLAAGLTLATCLVFLSSSTTSSAASGNIFKSGGNFVTDISAHEIKNNFKVFLTKMKVRKVPLAKKRSEVSLVKLFKDEKELKEEIANMEEDLNNIDRRRQTLGQAEILSKLSKDETKNLSSAQAKVKKLAAKKLEDLEKTLNLRKVQLEQIQNDIETAQEIIKNPEAFISIPNDFAQDPAKYRENEQELLIKDRENIMWRQQIMNNEILPTWITDKF